MRGTQSDGRQSGLFWGRRERRLPFCLTHSMLCSLGELVGQWRQLRIRESRWTGSRQRSIGVTSKACEICVHVLFRRQAEGVCFECWNQKSKYITSPCYSHARHCIHLCKSASTWTSQSEIIKQVAAAWRALSNKQRAFWDEEARNDKMR